MSGLPTVLGFDLSVTAPGVAGDGWASVFKYPRKKQTGDGRAYMHRRLRYVKECLGPYLSGIDLAVIEGLPFGGFDTERQNAGLSWWVRDMLWFHSVPYALVPPSNLKLYVTGSGAVDPKKKRMMAAIRKLFPDFRGDNNAADAIGLWLMGRDHLGVPVVRMPATNRAAMGKCEWPTVQSTNFAFAVDDTASGGGGEPKVGGP